MRDPRNFRLLGTIQSRAGLAQLSGRTFGGDRDLYEVLGYIENPSFDRFLSLYKRGGIAKRIVDLPAKTAWRRPPVVTSDDEEFVRQWSELNRRHRITAKLSKVDRLSGIGQYGVLFLGVSGTDGVDLDQPLEETPAAAQPERLVYLHVFHQGSADIQQWENDDADPRYGLPTLYVLKHNNETTGADGRNLASIKVHHTRVIHVAEDPVDDEVFGTPRLEAVLNRIDDLAKVVGGAAETFWQQIGGIWHADLSPEISATEEEMEELEQQLLAARHGLARTLQTRGMDVSMLGGNSADPSGIFDALRQLIAATAEIPERILFGSERGNLASEQDQREWEARVQSRQVDHCEPHILRPAIDRLIRAGILKAADYEVYWPPITDPEMSNHAEIAERLSKAVAAIFPGMGEQVIPAWEFREKVLGWESNPPAAPDGFFEALDEDLSATLVDEDGDE